MSEVNIQVSDRGVLILFDESNKDTKKLIAELKKHGVTFDTKRIYCG